MLPVWMTPPAPGPAQVDQGASLYYYHCMACHGDRGQGLSVEWRAQWAPGHQDCSVPQCHGSRHPPEGFTFPKNFAPPLVGDGALARYTTAQDLYDFVSKRMPYQAPGSLKPDQYWALVAFILQRRGAAVSNVGPANAGDILLHAPPERAANNLVWYGAGTLVLVGAAGGGVLWRRSVRAKHRRRS